VPNRSFRATVVLVGLLSFPASLRAAQDVDDGNLWVVLIATTTHDDKSLNLPYCEADITEVRRVLIERGQGVSPERIFVMAESGLGDRKPTLANFRKNLPDWLARPGPKDRLLVFFAGHGELSPTDRRTYLVPRDFDRARVKETGFPLAELRDQVAGCKARVKCLILDCCHAGNARAVHPFGAAAEAVAKAFDADRLTNTVVLAGARAGESSYACNRLRHGIYSFWLCRGLEGAGADEQGQVRVSLLNKYAHERTNAYSLVEWGKDQTPVMFGKVEGDPVLLTLKPEQPETLCRRLAEHLDLEIRRKKLTEVAVVEFLQPLGSGEGLGSGTLPGYCTAQVRAALRPLAGKDYQVWDDDRTAARTRDLSTRSLGNLRAMRQLAAGQPPLSALITGVLLPNGPDIQLTCRLYTTADGRMQEPFTGRLPLSEDLVADQGYSVDNAKRPTGSPHDPKVVEFVQKAAEAAHPLLDPNFPFRMEVWAALPAEGGKVPDRSLWKKKELVVVDGADGKKSDLVFGVRKGEVYEVRLWNRTGNRVACQLSVDGMNTLNKSRDRTGLGAAWVIRSDKKNKPSFVCEGWYEPKLDGPAGTIEATTMKPFVVVDAAESVAGRQRFGEKIGTITAVFFTEAGKALGTGEGPAEQRPVKTVDFKPGRLAGVIQLRYVDERDLKR
jgi:hypothetical protein